MCAFELCEGLSRKLFVADLPLSRVLLDRAKYLPWVLLVPRVVGVVQLTDLNMDDQMQLLRELNYTAHVMQDLFKSDRLNIAAIGNKTPQLHVHIICRSEGDPYWPETVWQYKCEKMTDAESESRVRAIQSRLEQYKIS
ncbi:MAG: HIT domain-containing protein [Opitutales bacterium]|nr:HIT domain-containing protein [Opitutales bacterium]